MSIVKKYKHELFLIKLMIFCNASNLGGYYSRREHGDVSK